jgi:nicotinate-nucleotide adenylyltransferase
MIKTGIMGGTFNPIHMGHLIAAEEVCCKLKLDRIVFIPTGNPPHKSKSEVISSRQRYEMTVLAAANNEKFIVSDIETNRKGLCYSYDTLSKLNNLYPDNEFYFIIGFDTLKELDTWKKINEVFIMCRFVVVNRDNNEFEMNEEIKAKKAHYGADIDIVRIPSIDISSTDIRKRINNGQNIRYMVPDEVYKYIIQNGLYRGDINEKL